MTENKQRLIAAFDKNPVERVKVHLQEWKAQTYIDVRVYFLNEEQTEHATKKGITLNVELLPELQAAINKALTVLELDENEESKKEEPCLEPEVPDSEIPF